MLEGKKPLAMFYAEISELPHEELVPESRFKPYLDSGRFVRGETTLELAYHPKLKRNVRAKYVFFALKAEEWRVPAITLVLQTGVKTRKYDETHERLISSLLGYTEAEIDALCAKLYGANAA